MSISSNATGLRPGVCTSTTRPTNPYLGQLIFQTDTGTMHNWDGAAWQFLAPTQQRNVLYNGAMQVAQRGTSTASITAAGYYTADRWQFIPYLMGTWTQSVENDAPTGSGFAKSLKALCTTADASPAAGDSVWFAQIFEGQDLQAIRKGTASAQQLTVSFWVKSNVTGTYIVQLIDNDNTRNCSKSYTISASATWEFKTITFPADTTGVLDNDNNGSMRIIFTLGVGSDYTSGTLQTTWGSTVTANRAVGQTNLAAATNNYWQITGVQLNVGGVAAPFEFKSYERELRECQRYYTLLTSGTSKELCNCGYYSSSVVAGVVHLPVEMRTTPTFANTTGTNYWNVLANNTSDAINTLTIQASSPLIVAWYNNTEASGTAGHAATLRSNNASAVVAVQAEL